jgi:hypothetical protein
MTVNAVGVWREVVTCDERATTGGYRRAVLVCGHTVIKRWPSHLHIPARTKCFQCGTSAAAVDPPPDTERQTPPTTSHARNR